MAAPHLDNPYGAKAEDDKEAESEPDTPKPESKSPAEESSSKQKQKIKPASNKNRNKIITCPHSFCNEPSDPSHYPKGLPWSTGLLKCLPGYCPNRRQGHISRAEVKGKTSKQKKGKSKTSRTKRIDGCKCGEFKKTLLETDPEVVDELMFFLRVVLMAGELDGNANIPKTTPKSQDHSSTIIEDGSKSAAGTPATPPPSATPVQPGTPETQLTPEPSERITPDQPLETEQSASEPPKETDEQQ